MTTAKEMIEALGVLPTGFAEVQALIDGIDSCFDSGFSRLGPNHFEHLVNVAKTLHGTPLGQRMKSAVEAMGKANFSREHFVTIAAVRSALCGAQYDTLVNQVRQHTSVARPEVPQDAPKELSGPMKNWMDSTQQWLLEVALSGFKQLVHDHVSPFDATLTQIQDDASAPRLAALLTGMTREWLSSMPISSMPVVPVKRWSDLWCRAMILSVGPYPEATSEVVTGEFLPFAVDLRHNSNMVSALFYGALKGNDGTTRLVRTTLSAYKVDAVTGDEVWQALDSKFDMLLAAYSKQTALKIGMKCYASGDLVWEPNKASNGSKFKIAEEVQALFEQEGVIFGDFAPLDRHPVHVAEPVFLTDYTCSGDALEVEGVKIALDMARVSDESPLSGALGSTQACFGLLRYDNGWRLQPLLGLNKGKPIRTGENASTKPKSTDAMAILQERAGKLLRR